MDVKEVIQQANSIGSIKFSDRYASSFDEIERAAEEIRQAGKKIVMVSGTYDLVHIGHCRYLRLARTYGDVLIVAVDDDQKVRDRKGESRPVVPEDERLEMLTHLRYVDLVVLKRSTDKPWEAVRRIRPDVLISIEEIHSKYSPERTKELEGYCGRIVIVDRQAETSTSNRVRRVIIGGVEMVKNAVSDAIDRVYKDVERVE